VWAVSLFVFFSVSKKKRSDYLLPIYPAMALLAGYTQDRGVTWWTESARWRKSVVWPLGGSAVGCLTVAVGLLAYCASAEPDWLKTILPISVLMGAGGIAAIWFLRQRRGTAVVLAIVLATAGSVAWGAGAVVSRVNDLMSPRSFCLAVEDDLADQNVLRLFNWYSTAYPYYTRKKFDYTQDPNQLAEWLESDERVCVLMKEKHYQMVMERLPLEMYIVHRQFVDHRWVLLVSNRPKER
jgi:4-amino-4-deoxy-L-arabinose transferase-like glycosyltransferase